MLQRKGKKCQTLVGLAASGNVELWRFSVWVEVSLQTEQPKRIKHHDKRNSWEQSRVCFWCLSCSLESQSSRKFRTASSKVFERR